MVEVNFYKPKPNSTAEIVDKKEQKTFFEKYKVPYGVLNRTPKFTITIPFVLPKEIPRDGDDGEVVDKIDNFTVTMIDSIVEHFVGSHFSVSDDEVSDKPPINLTYSLEKVFYGPGDYQIRLEITKVSTNERQDYLYPTLRCVQDIAYYLTSMRSKPARKFGLNGKAIFDIPDTPRGWGASPLDYKNVWGDYKEK